MTFPEGTDYNATAYIRCDDGYHSNGINTTNCMANGVWNKTSSCEINGRQIRNLQRNYHFIINFKVYMYGDAF